MSKTSDLHAKVSMDIEKKLCEELCMEPCQRTYEIATNLLAVVLTSLNCNLLEQEENKEE